MIEVAFPEPRFRLKKEKGVEYIFDAIRRQWLILTEEEWVRQNFIRFLTQTLSYPVDFIAVEKELQLGELRKRFDVLVYNKDHKPWLMVECKSTKIALGESALHQVLRYNISLPVLYLVITNGKNTFGWQKEGVGLKLITELPSWG